MCEQFNQELCLTGKIPSGLFNSMFEFFGSWQTDAANTQNLVFDGVFITLYSLALDKSHIVLKDHVRNAVPSSWDPAALAKYVNTILVFQMFCWLITINLLLFSLSILVKLVF